MELFLALELYLHSTYTKWIVWYWTVLTFNFFKQNLYLHQTELTELELFEQTE